jgi:hypothetical protein
MKTFLAFIIGLALLATTAQAQFRPAGPLAGNIVSSTVTVATSATTNLTATIPAGSAGVSLFPVWTNASTESVTFNVYSTPDGSTVPTLATYTNTVVNPSAGTVYRHQIHIPATSLGASAGVKVYITNSGTNSIYFSSLKWVTW